MNRPAIALLSALNAALVVAVGVGVPLVALSAMWALHYGFALDWWVFWRAAVDVWLIGHGVDVVFTLDDASAAVVGVEGATAPIPVTIALLGFALLTILLGRGAGRRIAHTAHAATGMTAGLVTFAAAGWALASSAAHPAAMPSIWQAALLPAAIFGAGCWFGFAGTRSRSGQVDEPPEPFETPRRRMSTALRGGAAAAAIVIFAASVLTTIRIVSSYAQIITLYEGLHADALGGSVLTLAQLALLPNLVVWAACWLVGPGFAVGAGSAVSPLATALGPMPTLPVLGALPAGDSSFGFAGLVVPVIAGFLAGAVFGTRAPADWLARLAVGAGMGATAGLVLGGLAWASAGAAGPGRLAVVGPDPWQVGLFAAIEVGASAVLGLLTLAVRPGRSRREAWPEGGTEAGARGGRRPRRVP